MRWIVTVGVVGLGVAVACGGQDGGRIESLGQPCRGFQILGTAVVTDRQDGRERLILLNDNETHHCQIVSVDFEKNTAEVFTAPAGAGSWCGIEVPGDRFVVGTFYDGVYLIFDLKNKRFEKVVDFPGEQYIWNLALGSDGRVYGGTYPGGKLGALDLRTMTCEDLGAPAKPNLYLRNLSAAPWGEIFANFGTEKPTTMRYDISGKKWLIIPYLKEGQQFGLGVSWNGLYVATDPRSGKIEAFRDASLVPVKEPGFPPLPEGAVLNTGFSDSQRLCVGAGGFLYFYVAGDRPVQWAKRKSAALHGGRFVAVAGDGTLLGVRGQSYVVMKPGSDVPEIRPIPAESMDRPTLFLEADSEGRIWGGPHFGQTLFHYDIQSGKTVNTDVVCDAGGEVYDVAFADGKVYAASYSGGDITCYDPREPWDQWHHKNPRPITSVSPQSYIRPIGGIRVGPDGKLYAGWQTQYGKYGGAISITDPATGETELIENPLGTQAVASFDLDRRFVYLGTSLAGNGLPNQKGKARFGVVELSSRQVVFQEEFDAASVIFVTREPKTGLVAFSVNRKLHLYDPASKAIAADPVVGIDELSGNSILAPGDGTLIAAASGNRIVRIDPAAKSFSVLAETPDGVSCMTIGADGRLYFSRREAFYRLAEPVRAMAQARGG